MPCLAPCSVFIAEGLTLLSSAQPPAAAGWGQPALTLHDCRQA